MIENIKKWLFCANVFMWDVEARIRIKLSNWLEASNAKFAIDYSKIVEELKNTYGERP